MDPPAQADRSDSDRPAGTWLVHLSVNLIGAALAAQFARASLLFYLQTHRLIGAAFFVEQAWFVVAFLVRRPPRASSRQLHAWLLAAGGTFGGLLFRPQGAHPALGVEIGLALQLVGVAAVVASLLTLGRSFGFVAADRGLVTRGPYRLVRHPVYACYILIQSGYLLQAISLRNLVVLLAVTGCNVGRCLAEERVLAGPSPYQEYRARVRWRMVPGVW
jgi:protein-S-isoprenylcysteine O-methyltransferase Ste14